MNNNYIVYKHTFPNNKVYIGITSQKLHRRFKGGKGYKNYNKKTQNKVYNAINKYGWECIKHEILYSNLTKQEAELKEIALIKKYKSNDSHFGYNIENGGNTVGKLSEETKKKIGDANRGRNNGNYNKKGILSPLSKKVNQYDLDGKIIKTWYSISDAERDLKIRNSNISQCCRNIRHTAGGFKWEYVELKKEDI